MVAGDRPRARRPWGAAERADTGNMVLARPQEATGGQRSKVQNGSGVSVFLSYPPGAAGRPRDAETNVTMLSSNGKVLSCKANRKFIWGLWEPRSGGHRFSGKRKCAWSGGGERIYKGKNWRLFEAF